MAWTPVSAGPDGGTWEDGEGNFAWTCYAEYTDEITPPEPPERTWTVPDGVRSITVAMRGAASHMQRGFIYPDPDYAQVAIAPVVVTTRVAVAPGDDLLTILGTTSWHNAPSPGQRYLGGSPGGGDGSHFQDPDNFWNSDGFGGGGASLLYREGGLIGVAGGRGGWTSGSGTPPFPLHEPIGPDSSLTIHPAGTSGTLTGQSTPTGESGGAGAGGWSGGAAGTATGIPLALGLPYGPGGNGEALRPPGTSRNSPDWPDGDDVVEEWFPTTSDSWAYFIAGAIVILWRPSLSRGWSVGHIGW